MRNENRNEAMLEIIRQGLVHANTESAQLLGDRSEYLGISDLARYSLCPRAALANKAMEPSQQLEKMFAMQRGHWFENGLTDCFRSLGLSFMGQLEISVCHDGVPVKAHLDFTLVWKEPYPAVRIVEVKSMNKLPKAAYEEHVFQAQAQVALMQRYWRESVFSLKDAAGRIVFADMRFPEICRQFLGIPMPEQPEQVSLESWLLCFSMKEIASFGPFVADQQFLENALSLSERAWAQYGILRHDMLALRGLPYAHGFQILCEYCEFTSDCPKFRTDSAQPEWEACISELAALKQRREELDSQIREIESSLREAYQLSGSRDWIEAGSYRFRVISASGRKTLDKSLLQSKLETLFQQCGLTEITAESIIARCERQGASTNRLQISSSS